eukprot:749773-Hanusia_phi.AAC.8
MGSAGKIHISGDVEGAGAPQLAALVRGGGGRRKRRREGEECCVCVGAMMCGQILILFVSGILLWAVHNKINRDNAAEAKKIKTVTPSRKAQLKSKLEGMQVEFRELKKKREEVLKQTKSS